MKTVISSRGQIVLPVQLREKDDIVAGQEFDIERVGRGKYQLKRREPPCNEGFVDAWLACPLKGFFTPIESESTDTLCDIWSTPTSSANR